MRIGILAMRFVLVCAAMHAGRTFLRTPGFDALFDALSPGYFVPFSAMAACAMGNLKAGVLVTHCVLLISAAPITDIQAFARIMLPQGAGILAGIALRGVANDFTDPKEQPDA